MQQSRWARGLALAGVCTGLAAGVVMTRNAARADTLSGCNLGFVASYIDVAVNDGVNFDGLSDATAVAAYGSSVYVVSKTDDSLLAVTRQADNTLAFSDFVQDNIFPINGLDAAAAVAVSSDGAFVYVAAGGTDKAVSAFAVSGSNTLTEIAVAPDSDGLGGASGIAISPDGKNIYATGATSDAVVAITRNTTTGVVVFRSRITNPNHGLNGASAVVVSPDNAQVYVTGKGDNAIAQFNRNTTTGDLTFVELQEQGVNMADGLSAPVALAISPDGAFVYTAASGDGKIGRYTRNMSNGQLDFSALAASGLSGISSLAMSADGTQLYVTTGTSGVGTVRIYNRNTSTGDLSLDSTLTDSSSSDTIKMRQATAVAVTADGQHVYVTAKQDNSLTAINAYLAAGTTCEAGNLCTADTCNGSGTCVTGPCQVGQACVDPSCAAGMCDNTGGPCVCKKLP